ncbi:TetR/AcrR family transcriptional regulator [Nonomuraea basaltis]|uniref:TetR/AcrR family transcriptional regulator n=1 Tax=Nonomuraea basaltis TaxID=2495887 RepID=UPI00110C487C|nr:helix-turn-helix domain-containing protein [Nonomuraea basaltis]TMR88203.1 TetR/AcrR family transcriptional regulator [Nonomuraea basaltis]
MAVGRAHRWMSPEERSEIYRERLIEAGLSLFGQVGFAAATLPDLCREGQMSHRGLYQAFQAFDGGKERVLAAVVDRCTDEAVLVIRERLAGGEGEGSAGVAAAVAAFVEYMTRKRRVYRILYVEAHHLTRVEARRDPLAIVLGEILNGQLSGKDARLVGTAIVGAVGALLADWYEHGDMPVHEVADAAVRVCRWASSFGRVDRWVCAE